LKHNLNPQMRSRMVRLIRLLLPAVLVLCGILHPQDDHLPVYSREYLIGAARELMAEARYCALITLDESGHPQAREMYPFLPDTSMIVWLGTTINSRKVDEIRKDPRVTLYYQVEEAKGYVTIRGRAEIIDDPVEKAHHFMPGWFEFYPDMTAFLPIKVTPEKLEIVSYPHQITGNEITWQAPAVEFDQK